MNLLYILNFINKIYEHKLFPKVLGIAIATLILLFIIIFLLGLKDARKLKNPRKEVEEDIKDITFNVVNEMENIKEDVTFEIPILTKNLEDFKKNIEEEIEKESKAKILQKAKKNEEEKKQAKILDMNEIEDTSILPVLPQDDIERLDEPDKEEKTKKKETGKDTKSEK